MKNGPRGAPSLQDGSIIWSLDGDAKPPPIAFDPAGKRFAIANGDTVTVIEFAL